jgi:hypothetical protein
MRELRGSSLGVLEHDKAAPEIVTCAESRLWVAVRGISLRRESDAVRVTLHWSRPPSGPGRVELEAFGHRADRNFAAMPKTRIEIVAGEVAAFDGDRRLPTTAIAVDVAEGETTCRLPLALLGRPQRLFVGVRSYAGVVPLDASPWHVVALP